MKLTGIVLVAIAAGIWVSVAVAGPPQVVRSTRGPIGALSSSSIQVGSLACKVGVRSPGLALTVGDPVGISCKDGVLTQLRKLDLTTFSADKAEHLNGSPVFSWTEATIGAVSATSITVGSLTCSVGSSSPSLAGYQVGDAVRIGCADGALAKIRKPEAPGAFTTAQGTIGALGATSITVGSLTCSVGPSSPSLAGYQVGDTVRIGCADGALAKIRKPEPRPAFTIAAGPISALSATSITVGPLTCSVSSSSPSLAGYQVGDTVRIGCADGALAKIEQPRAPSQLASGQGAIGALGASSITVGSLTCSVGPSSPSLAGVQVGDTVRIGCLDGVLAKIAKPQEEQHQFSTARGAIAALGASSITVGSLTCSVGSSSPSLAGVQVGDTVRIGCADGALAKIAKPQEEQHQFAAAQGAIAALGASSITVGSLTCSVGPSSPSLAGVQVGDRVGIGCADGVLAKIEKQQGPAA